MPETDEIAGAVRREVVLPVDRASAWEALRDARGLARWLADEVELDVREGATGRMRWRSGEERAVLVEEVEEGRRVALRWAAPSGEESSVELTLDDVDGSTRIVVLEIPCTLLEAVSAATVEAATHVGPSMLAVA